MIVITGRVIKTCHFDNAALMSNLLCRGAAMRMSSTSSAPQTGPSSTATHLLVVPVPRSTQPTSLAMCLSNVFCWQLVMRM
jgi:hypothetical protein